MEQVICSVGALQVEGARPTRQPQWMLAKKQEKNLTPSRMSCEPGQTLLASLFKSLMQEMALSDR